MFSEGFDREAFSRRLAAELKTLRLSIEKTQDELAHAIGITRVCYYNYENGSKLIPWEKCLALLFYFETMPASRRLLVERGLLQTNIAAENGASD